MTDQEIYTKIETIYNTEKGKPFIAHLVRSFLPFHRSTFMLENGKKKIMRCSITNTPLISKGEFVMFQIENHEEIFKNMVKGLSEENTENIVATKFKGKMMAIECDKSERLLCLNAVTQLFKFASSEYLKGNKHIGFLLKDERNKESVNNGSSPILNSQTQKYQNKFGSNQTVSNNPNSPKQTSQKTVLKSTTSLADSDVLQNLKKQLEGDGK